jgi:hypothetical protein
MRQTAARGVEELQNGVVEVERDMAEGDAQEITPRAVSVPQSLPAHLYKLTSKEVKFPTHMHKQSLKHPYSTFTHRFKHSYTYSSMQQNNSQNYLKIHKRLDF